MDITTIIGYLITPVTGAIGWFAGTRQRRNTAVQSLQETIGMLSATIQEDNAKIVNMLGDLQSLRAENADLKNEIKAVRMENAELKAGQNELMGQIESLKVENQELNSLIRSAGITRPRAKKAKGES
jgi:chromosome segregation ATPase